MGGVGSIPKVQEAEILLISRAHFFTFRWIFEDFGGFREFSGVVFPLFAVFSISRYGILAPRPRGCTIAHRQKVFKRANWASELTVLFFVDLGLKSLVLFGRIVCEYSQEV